MSTRVIRYRTNRERADENQKLVEAVFAELADRRPPGLSYLTVRSDDGVSFMHVVTIEDDQVEHPMTHVAAFAAFQAGIGDRCDEPPVATDVTVVGTYRSEVGSIGD